MGAAQQSLWKRFPAARARLALTGAVMLMCTCGGPPGSNAPVDAGQPEAPENGPRIAPYLDAKPSPIDGQGTATLTPSEPVPASGVRDFEVAFTVGEAGVAPGGFVLFQVSPWWGWSHPQTDFPEGPGYVAADVTPSHPLKVLALQGHRVVVTAPETGFQAGETVTLRYGNAQVDKYAEAEELFQVFVDADGDGNAAPIAQSPTLRTLPHEPVRLLVDVPSQAQPCDAIEITAAAVDVMGNWAPLPAGSYTVTTERDGETIRTLSAAAAEGDKQLATSVPLDATGIFFFTIRGPSGLEGRSNVLLCLDGAPSLNLYFGDIHGHSRQSDGTGTPEDYYAFARDASGLDIAALTDHADYGTIRIEGAPWDRIKAAANAAYEPGRFVTFVGYEWTNWVYGHRNVYFRDGDGPVFRSIDDASDTPQELWALLEPYEAMTIAHHVGGGPIHTDWSIPPGPCEYLVEICSIHGASEEYGGKACIYHPVQGAFVRDALLKGYRLGIIGSGDTHDGHPGQRSAGTLVTGIVGVYAPELTRESIWDAFKRRQVYATSGPKIILNFRVADAPLGSEVTWDPAQGAIPVSLRAIGCDAIEAVEIIRNGVVVHRQEGNGVTAYAMLLDAEPPEGPLWYYARVFQCDGGMAWSSPVWVDRPE